MHTHVQQEWQHSLTHAVQKTHSQANKFVFKFTIILQDFP